MFCKTNAFFGKNAIVLQNQCILCQNAIVVQNQCSSNKNEDH